MTIKEKNAILNGIQIEKEYIKSHFRTISYFIELEGWDVAGLFFTDLLNQNLFKSSLILLSLLKKEES
jgi:hypothetical protein